MAVNPNFTNANANTSYFSLSGGAGGSNFNTINVSTVNFTSGIGGLITTYPVVENGPGGVVVGTSNNTQPLTVESLAFGKNTYGVGQYTFSSWANTGLSIQGYTTGTTYSNVIQNNSQVAGTGQDTLSFFRISTIGVAQGTAANGQQINMVALASTLKSVYPSIVL